MYLKGKYNHTNCNRIAYCKFDYILHKYFLFSKGTFIRHTNNLLLNFYFSIFLQCFKPLHYQIVIYFESGYDFNVIFIL